MTVRGRVVRTFRQGSVGSFPPLAEVWITSAAGNPFCAVFPQPPVSDEESKRSGARIEAHAEKETDAGRADVRALSGQTVRFTGTFLKMVRYAGADGPRLAPLIVGDQRPAVGSPQPTEARTDHVFIGTSGGGRTAIQIAAWALGLAVAAMAAFTLARWHLRAPVPITGGRTKSAAVIPDPRLEFIEPPDEP